MEILLGDFNVKLIREVIFNTQGVSERLHQDINDNDVTIV
jgi:hypothetical protein